MTGFYAKNKKTNKKEAAINHGNLFNMKGESTAFLFDNHCANGLNGRFNVFKLL
jgi:hypothetical protein